MEKFKSGFVSIIGRTNVGKSTLINSLLGEKVAITANKSQTTRTVIKAIINNKKKTPHIYNILSVAAFPLSLVSVHIFAPLPVCPCVQNAKDGIRLQ